MANSGYSVDDILEEIRRKKKKEASGEMYKAEAEPIKKQPEKQQKTACRRQAVGKGDQ